MAAGEQVFNVRQLEDGETVFIMDLELDRKTLRKWLRDHNIRNHKRVKVKDYRGRTGEVDILDPARRAEWVKLFKAKRVKIWIIDPLAPLLSYYGFDEKDNFGMGQVLAAIDALAVEAGVDEVMIVHYMGHNGERSRGASRLRDWPDAEWRMVRPQEKDGEEPPPDAPRFFMHWA
jgi:RecA-family ATPase